MTGKSGEAFYRICTNLWIFRAVMVMTPLGFSYTVVATLLLSLLPSILKFSFLDCPFQVQLPDSKIYELNNFMQYFENPQKGALHLELDDIDDSGHGAVGRADHSLSFKNAVKGELTSMDNFKELFQEVLDVEWKDIRLVDV